MFFASAIPFRRRLSMRPTPRRPRGGAIPPMVTAGVMVLCTVAGCNRIDSMIGSRHQIQADRPMGPIHLIRLDADADGEIPEPMMQLPSRPTLLHFWATWCPPCRAEYPELDAMVDSFDADQVAFVSVACEGEPGESYRRMSDSVARFFDALEIESTAYGDPGGTTRSALADATDQPDLYLPTTVLLDAQHRIVRVWDGYDPDNIEDMRRAVEEMDSSK